MSKWHDRKIGRRVAAVAIGFGLLVCSVWYWVLSESTPVYRGESASYWFPKWVQPGATSPSRWPEDAGPDAMPFLLNFLKGMGKSIDLYKEDWLASNWDKLPDSIRKRLHHPIAPRERADLAIEAIFYILYDHPESVRELATAFADLPDYTKVGLITMLPRDPPELNALRRDLIRMALKSPNAELRDRAMMQVIFTAEDFVACLPEILHAAHADEAEGIPMLTSLKATRLADLGEIAAPLLPFLEKWRDYGSPRIRIVTVVAIARIRGGDESMLALLDSSIVAQGWDAVDRFLTTLSDLRSPSPKALLPFWINLASERGASDLISKLPVRASDPTNLVSKVRIIGLTQLPRFKADRMAITDAIVEALHASDSDVVVQALEMLDRFKEPPDAALPRLIQLLPNGSYRGYIVELLGKYGRRATNAIPILTALAEGRYPEEWTDREERLPMFRLSPQLARRYGVYPLDLEPPIPSNENEESASEVNHRLSYEARKALDAIENRR